MTYRNDEVVALSEEMVFVRINAEKDTLTAARYGLAGYPTIILTKPDGTEIDRIYGYLEAEEFIKTIRDYQAGRNTLADYLSRLEENPTSHMLYLIAGKYRDHKKYEDSERYLRKVLQNDPTNKEGYADNALLSIGELRMREKRYDTAIETYKKLALTYPESELVDDAFYSIGVTKRRAEKYDDAIAHFQKFIGVYPESDLIEDAEIYVAFCNNKKGEKDEAVRLYDKFIKDHPESSEIGWVKKQIDKIKNPPEEKKED